jgi:hypothetical protein
MTKARSEVTASRREIAAIEQKGNVSTVSKQRGNGRKLIYMIRVLWQSTIGSRSLQALDDHVDLSH